MEREAEGRATAPEPREVARHHLVEWPGGVDPARASGTEERFDLGQVLEDQASLILGLPIVIRGPVLDPAE
jgi:hypothetical protein